MSDAAAPALATGSIIGHYEVLSKLGAGGMGEVFLGRDTKLERNVAIKVLPREFGRDSGRLRRFELEAKALAALSHPNIVSVFSVEEHNGLHVLVMEFVEGRTLREIIPEGGLPIGQFFDIALGLTNAIDAAHARGVTHRDLKPENIMITASGWVKVLDFGLAKFRTLPASEPGDETRFFEPDLTTYGVLLGTAPYMSPEQAEGRPIDQRSDLFSLGSVFYEMLTGTQPFRGRSVAQLLSSILRDEPEPIRTSRLDVGPELRDLVSRCLRKEPDDRWVSAAAVQQSLLTVRRLLESAPVSDAVLLPASGPMPAAVEPSAAEFVAPRVLLDSRWGLTAILAVLWVVNWIETGAEDAWSVRRGAWIGYDFAGAFSWFERGLSFDGHDAAGPVAVYLGSVAYFFLPVVLLGVTLAVLIRRKSIDGYRLFTKAIVICYSLSLPFYLLLPIPERWAYPDSHAMLLSDLWSTRLIEAIRPMSGLDNCFPSFHTSGTMALVLVWYRLRLQFRHTIACLGAAVAVSTVLLGIHWVADVVAGLALAFVSVRLAGHTARR
jgi:membrane-associated phospholipid phosphatase/predicted Ser/Thr protein kinase